MGEGEEIVLWHLGNMTFHARTLINTWLVCLAILIFCFAGVRSLTSGKPGKMQNVLEWIVDFVKKLVSDNMNYEQGRPLLGYLLTLIMFVFFSNMVSVIPNLTFGLFENFHIEFAKLNEVFARGEYFSAAPTSDINVTMALALLTITLVLVLGVKTKGAHYFHHFLEPHPVFAIIHIIDLLAKPLTLAFRLFGNIFAGEILVKVIWMLGGEAGVSPAVLPGILPQVVWLAFSIFIGAIQAYVFTVLTTAYISQAVTPAEH